MKSPARFERTKEDNLVLQDSQTRFDKFKQDYEKRLKQLEVRVVYGSRNAKGER